MAELVDMFAACAHPLINDGQAIQTVQEVVERNRTRSPNSRVKQKINPDLSEFYSYS